MWRYHAGAAKAAGADSESAAGKGTETAASKAGRQDDAEWVRMSGIAEAIC
jgi:hypothetical protein